MDAEVEIIDVDAHNVEKYGFYCFRSKRKTEGYRQKLEWLKARLSEGLRIKILYVKGKQSGFIEYAPAECAWRPVVAPNFMVIHCLYRLRQIRGQGYGSLLLKTCLDEAAGRKMDGVAAVVGVGTWLPDRQIFDRNGFETADRAPASFELLARRFNGAPAPRFPHDWEERLARYPSGLTVVYAPQCPYNARSVEAVLAAGAERGLQTTALELKTPQEAQARAPSPFGLFNVVYEGKLIAHHPISKDSLLELLDES